MNKATALALMLVVAVGASGAAQAQTAPKRQLYDETMRCMIANAIAIGERKRAGDLAKAAHYDRMAEKSFKIAYILGDALRFDRAQIDADFEKARRQELPAMMRDQAYYYRVVALCKSYELM